MTPDDLTAPDRPEDLNPPEPNDSLRRDLRRVLDAADTVGLTIRSIGTGWNWFVHGADPDGWHLERARAFAAALDAAIIDVSVTQDSRYDFLNVRLNDSTTLHIEIQKQTTAADLQAAALTLGRLAGQGTSPAWVDPHRCP